MHNAPLSTSKTGVLSSCGVFMTRCTGVSLGVGEHGVMIFLYLKPMVVLRRCRVFLVWEETDWCLKRGVTEGSAM